MIDASLFIANLSHPQRSEKIFSSENNTQYLLPPEIFNLPTATNSSVLKISGRAEIGKDLQIFVNGVNQTEFNLTEETFETEINLEKGENLIYLILKDPQTNKKKKSEIYKVFYKAEKPRLEIIRPENNSIVKEEEIKIEGKTEKEVLVKINENPVVVNANNEFIYPLKLQPGENKISIKATDIAGNEEIKELTINYQKED